MKGACAGALAAVALVVLPASAGAQTAVYPPDEEQQHFTTSEAGYTSGQFAFGLCIQSLTCPSVDNHYVATGGASGAGGFLRSEFGALTGVAGETLASWTSPAFEYTGVGGKKPTELVATIARRSTLNALLDVVGNSAEYFVQVIDVTETHPVPITTNLIQGSLEPTNEWVSSGHVVLDPDTLVIGNSYHLRIVSHLRYGVEAVAGGRADYDDVEITATREGADDDDDDRRGDNRPGGRNAIFDGRNLFIKLRCFGEQGDNGKCFTRATALKTKKGVRYTFPIQRIVKAKKGKVIRARVRFQYRKELEKRKSIILKSVLRTDRDDETKEIKFKKLRLIDRSPD